MFALSVIYAVAATKMTNFEKGETPKKLASKVPLHLRGFFIALT